MATVGNPHQVVEDDGAFETEPVSSSTIEPDAHARSPRKPTKTRRPSILVFAICLATFFALMTLAAFQFVQAWQDSHGEVVSGDPQVNAYRALQELHKAQKHFQQSETVDVNGDGIGDYGTIEQLHESERYHDVFRKMGYATGYEFLIEVTQGDENTEPGFTCVAQKEQPSRSAKNFLGESDSNEAEMLYMPANRHFFMDQTGVIRYTEDGTTPTVESKPQWEAE
jgi:hypothetical protein